MNISFNCPNDDCEADLEAEVTISGGSRGTMEEPTEAPDEEIEREDKCPKCGTDLSSCDETISKLAWQQIAEDRKEDAFRREEYRVEAYNDRMGGRYGL